MDEPVRWGVLGTGRIVGRFLAGARESKRAAVVAIGGRTLERARAVAAGASIPGAFGSFEEVLADPDVEAVYNALPNGLHHPWTMAALRAGKHVLCEKPYSRRPDEVVEAFDLADASGLALSEAFMWRHHPQARRIAELLPELGELQVIRASFSFVLGRDPDVRLQADLDGGCLMDVGTYCVSGARLLAGAEPRRVTGFATPGPTGVDLRFSGILEFPSGVTAEISASFTTTSRGLEAIGRDGSLRLTDPWNAEPAVMERDGVRTEFEPVDQYRLEIDDLGTAIRDGKAPLLGRADALGQARTIDALYRSAATGTAVDL
jgi:D-xylose 1-dehydrogenase (NADP+, D-xylono-1,5-lactone-forming)